MFELNWQKAKESKRVTVLLDELAAWAVVKDDEERVIGSVIGDAYGMPDYRGFFRRAGIHFRTVKI